MGLAVSCPDQLLMCCKVTQAGQSVPNILNFDALAKLYDAGLNDLNHYGQGQTGESILPKGKHIFGAVRVGKRRQIALPNQL